MSDVDILVAAGAAADPAARPPRLGFLGVGWIGRHRMEALLAAGAAEAVAIADPAPDCLDAALALAPDARPAAGLDDLLAHDLDGLVIATPSAQHAPEAIRALEAGVSVFCQKPLARTAQEAAAVVDAARRADRRLAVDLSYRFTAGAQRIRELVRTGGLGEVFAADLVFHNAYGPDKAWFYDPALSGGGCVIDLGVHLVDLALWTLDFPAVASVESALFAGGRPLARPAEQTEDFAVATLRLTDGGVLRLTCSWRLHAGRDAEISAAFYGTGGGAVLRNVEGSFYDFTAERLSGTAAERLAAPPDAWGGRAAVDWARRLGEDRRFDPACARLVDVAAVIDRIYGR
jgi:predicted dehydrogenase